MIFICKNILRSTLGNHNLYSLYTRMQLKLMSLNILHGTGNYLTEIIFHRRITYAPSRMIRTVIHSAFTQAQNWSPLIEISERNFCGYLEERSDWFACSR